MLRVKISGHGREGLDLIKSIQPSALLWPCWNWGGLACEYRMVLLQRDPLEDAFYGKSLLLAPSASSLCIRIQDDAVSQHHCRIRPYLRVKAAASLWQLAQTMNQPVELRWHHLVLCFEAGRFGQGRNHYAVDKDSSQLPTKHPGAYLILFILFSLFAESSKELHPKELIRKRLPPLQTILQASVGFQLSPGWLSVARHAGPVVCPNACGGTKGCCHRYGNK